MADTLTPPTAVNTGTPLTTEFSGNDGINRSNDTNQPSEDTLSCDNDASSGPHSPPQVAPTLWHIHPADWSVWDHIWLGMGISKLAAVEEGECSAPWRKEAWRTPLYTRDTTLDVTGLEEACLQGSRIMNHDNGMND